MVTGPLDRGDSGDSGNGGDSGHGGDSGNGGDSGGEGPVRLLAVVSGHVQGVGFRWWTRCRARELGLVGHATNLADGSVEVSAQGRRTSCERLLALLDPAAADGAGRGSGRLRGRYQRRPGRVTGVRHEWLPPTEGTATFDER